MYCYYVICAFYHTLIDRNSEFHNSDFEALIPEITDAYGGGKPKI